MGIWSAMLWGYMWDDKDKSNYKVRYAQIFMDNLDYADLADSVAILATFIDKMGLNELLENWEESLTQALVDEDIRISMIEEQSE